MKTIFESSGIAEAMRDYVLETAPVLALYLDANLCIIGANAQARQMLREDAVGHPLADQIVDFGGSLDLSSLIKQRGTVHRLTLSTSSGMPETLVFRFFLLPDGVLVLASLDIQEQQKLRDEALGLNRELNGLSRQLHQANAELRDLNELKDRFVGMAAHDLRAPVGIIAPSLELVLEEAGDRLNDEHREFLRAAIAAAAGMLHLIENFLDVSVIESGHLRLERSRTRMSEILAGVLPLVRPGAARKKIQLFTESGGGERLVDVDVAKLQQILVNLVNNAVQHSIAGQRVWIETRLAGEELVLSVRDEGPGISPEDQKRLFIPFVRAGTRKTAGERSVGLGLAIVRNLVEAHGGHIKVESDPGHGAMFIVTVPVEGRGTQ